MSNLTLSLIITGLGMGLVFVAILLLWALMEIVVRLTSKESSEEEPEGVEESPTSAGFKQRVAAAAVSVALALGRGSGMTSSSAAAGGSTNPSVWLAAGRLAALNQPAPAKHRKA